MNAIWRIAPGVKENKEAILQESINQKKNPEDYDSKFSATSTTGLLKMSMELVCVSNPRNCLAVQ